MKKNKGRVVLVIAFLVIFAIYMAISLRGEYLQTLEIGEKYLSVFWQNTRYKLIIGVLNFVVLYLATYITTRFIKRGLKKFFEEDKKEMPKLPNKSISLILSVLISIISSNFLTQKAIPALNSAFFGINDPIFNVDLGYYIFIKPFISFLLIYFIVIMVILLIYIAAYYIIIFNKYFENGIDPKTLKKNTFIKQITTNIILIIIAISALTILNTQNVLTAKFLNLPNDLSLYGAGILDVAIKVWGYRIFALVILVCSIMAIKNFKNENFKKVALWLCSIPIYLVVLFLVIMGFDLIYVNKNELDKEKQYIQNNIAFTKNAYDINIDEIEIQNSGTIQNSDIENNRNIVNNINILNEKSVIEELNAFKTSSGYYKYSNTKPGEYVIGGQNSLVYVTPREIISNDTRTYNNKTYEYTHGYGVIINTASSVDENGNLEYIQSEFEEDGNKVNVSTPRIYFGMETNDPIIVNAKNKSEFDYPVGSTDSKENTYDGQAGLKLNFIDRFILGLREKKLGLAFTGNLTNESKVITSRNIRQRAKNILPYLKYDENPYMVVTDEGRLVWVLDAYTTSNNYPYSQPTIIEYEGLKEKVNYVRNSVKVLVDAYDGTIKFYITDETDPIAICYKNLYKDLFEEEKIPEDIAKHIVYSKYLYNIQAQVIKTYHNVQPEVLYRQDDIWDISKENTTRTTSSVTGTDIKPYYTMVKTVDNDQERVGLVIPYTIYNKQNIISYLVGTYDKENNMKLTLYKFKSENAILGTTQLDTLVEQDETISKELNALNTPGTKIQKNIIVVPINNTLLYVEPIYQDMLNDDNQVPVLKKVIVASGNKVAIGNDVQEAIKNLLSKEAIKIEFVSENKNELIEQIINANKNLEQSNQSGDWEMIGKDMAKLQSLINQLETVNEQEKLQEEKTEKTENTDKNKSTNQNVLNRIGL